MKIYVELDKATNVIKDLKSNCDNRFYDEALMDACSELYGLKPANVVPITYADYKWMGTYYNCSGCNEKYYDTKIRKYCSECGAKFKGE